MSAKPPAFSSLPPIRDMPQRNTISAFVTTAVSTVCRRMIARPRDSSSWRPIRDTSRHKIFSRHRPRTIITVSRRTIARAQLFEPAGARCPRRQCGRSWRPRRCQERSRAGLLDLLHATSGRELDGRNLAHTARTRTDQERQQWVGSGHLPRRRGYLLVARYPVSNFDYSNAASKRS